MSALRAYDAIVIGGGVSGLVAGTYLAKSGKSVLLLEARNKLGGQCARADIGEGFSGSLGAHVLYALDRLVVRDLKLARNGLHFSGHELALTGLRTDGKHIVITRNVHDTASSIAAHSQRDAEAWPSFRKELFTLARAMRPLWWNADGASPAGVEGRPIQRIAHMGSAAWLDSWFESDALKATLCFDSTAGCLSTLEPGSALSLIWRAAQEMSGLQGAVAIPQGGLVPLVDALTSAARSAGCELRTGTRVDRVIFDGPHVAGVQAQSGETCFAPMVFSAVNSSRALSGLLPPSVLGIAYTEILPSVSPLAEVKVVITLRTAPQIGSAAILPASRFVLAEKPETYIAAEMSARAGDFPDELPLEFVLPTMFDKSLAPPGQHILSVLVRPISRRLACSAAFASALEAKVVASLERLAPGFSRDIARVEILNSADGDATSSTTVSHMLTTALRRVQTSIPGLYACGADAEPMPAISGRAARIAAELAGLA